LLALVGVPVAHAPGGVVNPGFGVPAATSNPLGHRDLQQREHALSLESAWLSTTSRQNDRNPIIWQAGQDYRMADAIQAARHQPTRCGPERMGPER
jgi:hypothetical protein